MLTSNFQLVVISSESEVANEIESVHALFYAGLEIFHLRKPGWSDAEYDNWLAMISSQCRSQITVHGRPDIAQKWRLGGVHLKSDDSSQLLSEIRLSKSFHDLNDILQIEEGEFHYVTFSPVFSSISKTDYHPSYKVSEIEKSLITATTKVFALGGVKKGNLLKLKDMGFDGAALLGDFWRQNPIDRKTYFEECKILL